MISAEIDGKSLGEQCYRAYKKLGEMYRVQILHLVASQYIRSG